MLLLIFLKGRNSRDKRLKWNQNSYNTRSETVYILLKIKTHYAHINKKSVHLQWALTVCYPAMLAVFTLPPLQLPRLEAVAVTVHQSAADRLLTHTKTVFIIFNEHAIKINSCFYNTQHHHIYLKVLTSSEPDYHLKFPVLLDMNQIHDFSPKQIYIQYFLLSNTFMTQIKLILTELFKPKTDFFSFWLQHFMK